MARRPHGSIHIDKILNGRLSRLTGRYLGRWRPGAERRKGKDGEPEREPVEPSKPKDLSGGAAAELEFDD